MLRHKNSVDIIHQVEIVGVARIVYDEKAMKLQGLLIDKNGRCFSLSGYIVPDEKQYKTQQSTVLSANFDVLDEASHNFKIDNVIMKLDIEPKTRHRRITLEHPLLKFITERCHRGYKADIEIFEHINPQMVGYGCDLFVGNMTIRIISTNSFVPLERRLSVMDDNVVESSSDFLA
ncbi:hypothetical protein ACH3XW_42370 [Acanthocheilonema viteae]